MKIPVTMPENWEYKDVFLEGPPVHEPYDAFRLRHPSMPLSRRAKIFAPFSALSGLDDALAAKEQASENG